MNMLNAYKTEKDTIKKLYTFNFTTEEDVNISIIDAVTSKI